MRIAAALAFVLLAACAKSSNGAAASASASAEAANPASASDGAVVYIANCSSCHQADGQGVSGAFPPLAGNPVVTGNPTAVIAIVKNGLDGKVVVNGQAYSGIMPRWGGVLSDEQIAAAITYVRSSWHNRAAGVSVAQVHAVK
ncbi:MAG TPA: cytochrome c [Candidatus Binatia bacterium]|nr:cytochrome c [Candidatus Binatia bacterium]